MAVREAEKVTFAWGLNRWKARATSRKRLLWVTQPVLSGPLGKPTRTIVPAPSATSQERFSRLMAGTSPAPSFALMWWLTPRARMVMRGSAAPSANGIVITVLRALPCCPRVGVLYRALSLVRVLKLRMRSTTPGSMPPPLSLTAMESRDPSSLTAIATSGGTPTVSQASMALSINSFTTTVAKL
jgi:hypothetical protein